MSTPIHNPHDAFMKSLLADIDRARDFLTQFLPAQVLESVNLQTLQPEKSSFVSAELQEVFADAVFSVRLKNGPPDKECLISILLEHKSYVDEQAAFQLLLYLAQAYREQWKNRQALRPIIPFLFYHGKESWNFRPLASFFEETYGAFLSYIPQQETIYIDLTRMSEESIQQAANVWIRAALLTQKYSHSPEELARRAAQIFQTLVDATGGNFLKEMMVYFFSIVEISSEQLKEVLKPLPSSIKTTIMSTYDMILQKGREEGLQEGRQEGLQEGLEKGLEKGLEEAKTQVVLRGLENGLPKETLALITGLSMDEVEAILERAKGVDS